MKFWRRSSKKVPVKKVPVKSTQEVLEEKKLIYRKLLDKTFKKVRSDRKYLTPQETALYRVFASKEYQKKPYTPVFLQKKELELENSGTDTYTIKGKAKVKKSNLATAKEEREKIGFSLSIPYFFGLAFNDFKEEGHVLCSLEDLDDDGRTVRDPQAVDKDENIITGLTKSEDFPFRRPE